LTRDATPKGSSPAIRTLSPALILCGLLLVAGNLRAGITAVGPVLAQVQADLQLSAVAASALISLPLIAFAVVSPLAPSLARVLGLERALGVALGALAIGLAIRSVPGPGLLWVGTILLGAAIAVINVILPAVIKRDFPTRIGRVTGAYSAVQAVFAAIAAGVAVPVADLAPGGWRIALGMWAGFALVALGVLLPQVRRPHRHGDTGLIDGPASVRSDTSPWRSWLGWQVTAFMGLQSIGFYVFITWLPSMETSAGVSAADAGLHQLMLNGAGIAGSILCSTLIPRLRDQRLLAVAAPMVFAVSVAGVLVLPTLGALWSTVAGIAGGASIVLALSFFGLRTRHHLDAARLSGMAQGVGYLLAATGPVAAGALYDATGSWTSPLIALLVLQLLVALVGSLAGRNRFVGAVR
jgi:CP family cyanate transporter-like MFS transporter